MDVASARGALAAHAVPEKTAFFPRFFKTGPGEYGEGDQFLGVTVPDIRRIAKDYTDLPRAGVTALLHSRWHEERLLALIILVGQYKRAADAGRRDIYEFYLSQTAYINNWDLVDLSCRDIVGWYAHDHPAEQQRLDSLAHSKLLWDRRIAMVSTMYFSMHGDPEPTLRIAALLVHDKHDLIQKAVGWMLREMGKRIDDQLIVGFLREHYDDMGRTCLRYAIEKFPATTRARYLKGQF